MDDRDLRKLALRMSVEASPEAPAAQALADLQPPESPPTEPTREAPTAGGETHAPGEGVQPIPITACTSPEDAKLMAAGLKAKANPAEWMFDRLCRMIEDFESKLSAEEEVGATIVGAPGEGAFHVDDIGFWGPDLIMFYGKNMHGRGVRLIQHYQQLSVLLSALPRQEEAKPARRIGFALRTRMEEAVAENVPAPPPAPTAGRAVPVGWAAKPSDARGERP